MGLFDILKGNAYTTSEKNKLAAIDPSKYVPVAQFEALQKQVAELLQAKPEQIGTSKFLTEDDLPDLTLYAKKEDIPDTVKYIENSNTNSKIKRFTLSIEDKATFKPDSNPTDNIAHTI